MDKTFTAYNGGFIIMPAMLALVQQIKLHQLLGSYEWPTI
jgi:hypothetical protein